MEKEETEKKEMEKEERKETPKSQEQQQKKQTPIQLLFTKQSELENRISQLEKGVNLLLDAIQKQQQQANSENPNPNAGISGNPLLDALISKALFPGHGDPLKDLKEKLFEVALMDVIRKIKRKDMTEKILDRILLKMANKFDVDVSDLKESEEGEE